MDFRVRAVSFLPLPHCICSGSNPRLVETRRLRVYQRDIILSPFVLYLEVWFSVVRCLDLSAIGLYLLLYSASLILVSSSWMKFLTVMFLTSLDFHLIFEGTALFGIIGIMCFDSCRPLSLHWSSVEYFSFLNMFPLAPSVKLDTLLLLWCVLVCLWIKLLLLTLGHYCLFCWLGLGLHIYGQIYSL